MAKQQEKDNTTADVEKDKRCGIIMPISPHPDYPHDHWKDVLNIITESINDTQFKANLVSDDEAIGLIHERIVTNIYNNEMIVCDVSSRNPNVMFELGMRLAFDKPVIIIKDEKTTYSFDTGVIEHLTYPSSLRFGDIVNFKNDLSKRIEATYKKATNTTNFSPFLKGFGKTIIPAKIQGEEVTETKFLIDQIYGLKDEMKRLRFDLNNNASTSIPESSLLISSNRMIRPYFNELMSISKVGVTKRDLLDFVIEKFKEKYPDITKDEADKMVNDFWTSLTNKR